jgi:DUF4097 and DUF4098 domain-containing protein YvlB
MPTFDTPEPISVTIALVIGDVRISAGERSDTVVVVSPSDSSKRSDVEAAEQTRVEYSNGGLLIKAPRSWKHYSPFRGAESIDVSIELPAGSHVDGEASVADFSCDGRLGECRFTTSAGQIRVAQAGSLYLNTSAGRITVDRVVGRAEITGCGQVRIGHIDGPAVLKNLNGATWVGEVTGDLRCNASNGEISVDRALASVDAKTANGDVRVGEVVRGSVVLKTAYGQLEVGIRPGTAALLDVASQFGRVHNSLTASDGPGVSDQTVQVQARTSYGDITIRRSMPSPPAAETPWRQ